MQPEVQLQNGCLGKATRVNAPKIKDNVRAIPNFMALAQYIDALAQYVSKTDQHIGSFPVRIGTSEVSYSEYFALTSQVAPLCLC